MASWLPKFRDKEKQKERKGEEQLKKNNNKKRGKIGAAVSFLATRFWSVLLVLSSLQWSCAAAGLRCNPASFFYKEMGPER